MRQLGPDNATHVKIVVTDRQGQLPYQHEHSALHA
jgi:hypothetical protein